MERAELQTDEYFTAIEKGAEFLMKHGPAPGNRVYFCLSQTGEVREGSNVWHLRAVMALHAACQAATQDLL